MDWDEWNAFYWDSNKEYVMAENGELEEVRTGNEITPSTTTPGVYEYRKNEAIDSLKKLEEEERMIQEKKRKLLESQKSSFVPIEKKSKEKGTARIQWSLSPFII